MGNAVKKPEPTPTRGVPITDPSFVPEYDDEGIIINDPDCPPLSPERLARMRRRAPRPIPLSTLRSYAQLTQAQLAEAAQLTQPYVSKLENAAGDEVQLATLRKYLAACGAELEIHAVRGQGRWVIKL